MDEQTNEGALEVAASTTFIAMLGSPPDCLRAAIVFPDLRQEL